ncbi:RbsA2 [Desulforapulum autotrophicum HRM2]|uniref:RbsA2 n=1 Tax=Desulforapulum autotrophicum (strain ATCC 43914 / DSM 3382 / VKM B-1955 / HRM2) TaxID=177437 RepID=C0Q933_DESAH|nr:ATP-binding cassette domain-containing protein [Desulforapulum autotrophicum]ACN16538.1 RbsA2 [Desulforapulum autotrophicum HRM2]
MSEILKIQSISRHFGAVKALQNVRFTVKKGEVVALCGDNGAGKSTLIKIISGADTPTKGEIYLDQKKVDFSSPADALEKGIATTYQDLALAPDMKVYENIFMGAELMSKSLIPGIRVLDKKQMKKQAVAYLEKLNASVKDADALVNTLSGGQRQAVAISRALRWNAQIVIMDEPTAALGVKETQGVLELIRQLKAQGVTVLLISHNMEDITMVADRAIILKGGMKLGECDLKNTSPRDLGKMIINGERPEDGKMF